MTPKVKSQFPLHVTAGKKKKSPLGNLILGKIKLALPVRHCGPEKQEEQTQHNADSPPPYKATPAWEYLEVSSPSQHLTATAAPDCCSSSLNYRRKWYDLLKAQYLPGSGFPGDYHMPQVASRL